MAVYVYDGARHRPVYIRIETRTCDIYRFRFQNMQSVLGIFGISKFPYMVRYFIHLIYFVPTSNFPESAFLLPSSNIFRTTVMAVQCAATSDHNNYTTASAPKNLLDLNQTINKSRRPSRVRAVH